MDAVTIYESSSLKIYDLTGQGKSWHEMPKPRRWHFCRPVTLSIFLDNRAVVERCMCGSLRTNGGRQWERRNTRSS